MRCAAAAGVTCRGSSPKNSSARAAMSSRAVAGASFCSCALQPTARLEAGKSGSFAHRTAAVSAASNGQLLRLMAP